jgi:hypothetical protein
VGRTGGVFDFQGQLEIALRGGASAKQAFRGEGDPIGKIAAGYAPDVRRNAAAGMEQNVEFHPHFDRRHRFVHHRQRRNLRGQQTAETNQNRNESNDLGEIHFSSFDFTPGTA